MTTDQKTAATRSASRKVAIAALAMTPAHLLTEAKWIADHSGTLDKRVHAAGVALIIASMPKSEGGGNFNIAAAIPFISAISAGQSRNRIVAWVHKFSNIRLGAKKQEDGSFSFTARLLKQADPEYVKADPLAANDMPFWLAFNEGEAVDVTFTTTSLTQSLASILRRVQKAKDADKLDLTPKDLAIVASLTKLNEEVKARAEQRKLERDTAANKAAGADRKPTTNPNPVRAKAAKALAKANVKDAQQMAVSA